MSSYSGAPPATFTADWQALDTENDDSSDEDPEEGGDDYDGVRRTSDILQASDNLQLDEVPADLAADDGVDQAIINGTLDEAAHNNRDKRKYLDLPLKRINLSEYRRIYEGNLTRLAFQNLTERTEIVLDSPMIYKSASPDLAWDMSKDFLDFLLVVSAKIGFDAILPNISNDPNFVFHLDLHQPARIFKSKHANVGFSLERCMLYIGTSRGKDNIWMAMAPDEFFDTSGSHRDAFPSSGPSCLLGRHYWMLVMYLAHVITTAVPAREVYCTDTYPDLSDNPRSNVEATTNLLKNPTFELFHKDLSSVHAAFESMWDGWVRQAPAAWKDDGFITSRRPITVLCRYGQNQPIANVSTLTSDRRFWLNERDYSKIKSVTLAIASHLSAKKASKWRDISVDSIQHSHPQIYNSPYPRDRQEVDLSKLNLLDDNRCEIPIYDTEGYRIPRRTAMFTSDRLPCGLLVALEKIPELFESTVFDSELEEDEPAPNIWMYPQAFTKSHGHIQSDAVPTAFRRLVESLNDRVARLITVDSGSDSDSDYGPSSDTAVPSTALHCLFTQIYNNIMHKARPRAADHDAQLGQVTNACSGSHAIGVTQKRIAKRMSQTCDKALPHQHFRQRTDGDSVSTDLRLEVVTTIDISKLKPEHQNGSNIYKYVIMELAKIWRRAEIVEPLKNVVTVIRPHAFPALYNWTPFGICELIDHLYAHCSALLKQGKPIDPMLVELMSILERTLNFAHTGNTRVIATGLMNPLFVGQSLIIHGTPTFSDALRMGKTSADLPHIPDNHWPRDALTQQPRVASKRSQILTYGVEHWETYHAIFAMKFAMVTLPRHIFHKHTPNNRYCLVVADIAVRRFIVDTKVMVRDGILHENQAISDGEASPLQEAALRRIDNMDLWLKSEEPLSYAEDAYLPLLRCLNRPKMALALPLGNDQSMSTLELASTLFHMAKPDNPKQRQAPISNKGSFLAVLKVAIGLILQRATPSDSTSPEKYTISILGSALDFHKIHHIPWSTPSVLGSTGRPNRKAVYNFWRSTGKTIESGQTAVMQVLQTDEREEVELRDIAKLAEKSDATADWDAISLSVSEFTKFLHKQCLPEDCSTLAATISNKTDYMGRTYGWVITHYNSTKPVHKLALITAFLFTKVVPYTGHGAASSELKSIGRNSAAITAAVRAEPWTDNTSTRKGSSDPTPFLAMVFVYIIGLMEPESPLRQYMQENAKESLGELWTKKHGHKFINGFNMVRLGLADAHSAAIYNSPKYGRTQSWSMKSVGDLTAFYKRLIATISEKPYGPYKATAMILGKGVADRLARDTDSNTSQFAAPPQSSARPVSITEQQPSSSKRALAARQEGNDEDLYPTLLTQKRLRQY